MWKSNKYYRSGRPALKARGLVNDPAKVGHAYACAGYYIGQPSEGNSKRPQSDCASGYFSGVAKGTGLLRKADRDII